MLRALDGRELNELLRALTQPAALIEAAVLFGCLAVAWAVVRMMRGRHPPVASIWFGNRIVDGVLFPVLALAFAFGARIALESVLMPAVFRLAIPILVSLVLIRLTVRVLGATFPNAPWVRVFERSLSWVAWIAVVLWVTGIFPLMLDAMGDVRWKVGATQISLRNVVEGTLTAGVVLVLALWVSAAIERRLLAKPGADLSLRKMAANVVRTLLLFVGLLLALSAVGIDLTALSVLGGALGVGLGFGLQKIAANYVSGFVILAERSLRIGDMVKVDTFEGRITDIRTRYTIIRSLAGRESIVPNETLITQRVENSSLADPRVLLSSTVQVAYGTDVRALQSTLIEAMRRIPRIIDDPAPSVLLSSFAADGIELTLQFWIRDAENGQGNVRSEVNLAVLAVLNEAKIEIPYPQRVVRAVVSMEANADPASPGPARAPLTASARPAISRRLHVMRTIETAALRLEPQLAQHADEMFGVLSDPAIYEYENQAPASLEALRRRYAALESRRSPDGAEQWLNWVIRLPHGEAIGYVQATVWPGGRAAIAYELGSAWWGRGLARRAVEAMVDELVAQHGADRLAAVLKRANLRSRRLLERLGFELASPDEHRRRGAEADELLMERAAERAQPPSASDRLRALARRVAAAHLVAGSPPPMSLVSGSTVDDIADARSDVDMSVVYERLPPEADLRAAGAAAGGLPWFWQAGSLADGSLVVAFKLDGVEVQIGYSDFATLEREIDEVVVRHNPDTPLHKLAEGLLKAEPLLDADRLRSLQARVAVFPPALGRAMAQHFIGRVTPWRAIAQLLHRDAALWCRELQVEVCYKLVGALAGLNGVYFTTFQFKRMTRFAAKLRRAPADFSGRIDALLQAETVASFDALHALEGEVVALLAAQWPDLDLAAVRERRAAYAPGGVG